MNVVLDTNVLVSAAISPKGSPAEILRAWRAGSFTWVTSPALLTELERTLASPRIKRYLSWTEDETLEFLERLRQAVVAVAPTDEINVITRDPDDNRVLEAAVAGQADYIVSGDNALLELQTYEGAQIVTPARFVAIMGTL